MRQRRVKQLQKELGQLVEKKRWFAERVDSIATESLKLEEESRRARHLGLVARIKAIEEFLEGLSEAQKAMRLKEAEMAKEVALFRKKLEEAAKACKVVEKIDEHHYNHRMKKRRKSGEF
ncbi:MAG: hypothetical protein S4CHLAM81_02460 [Chlamydiales bacterium]|nr:hypothetical protein [Chlamydiales bacterium]MCH9635038.1 hypothetical protein [Chlamydiales bacterium]